MNGLGFRVSEFRGCRVMGLSNGLEFCDLEVLILG